MNGNIHPEAAQLRETLCADDIMEKEEKDQKAGAEKVEKAEIKDGSLEVDKGEYRVYTMRWIILAMFVFYSASNAFQWTQLVRIHRLRLIFSNTAQNKMTHILSKDFLTIDI